MSKKLVFIDQSINLTSTPINWNLCIICQSQTREKLQCPADSLRSDVGCGYASLSDVLPKFAGIGALPRGVDLARFDDGSGLFLTFSKNRAKWHKSCRNAYSQRELDRKLAKLQATNDNDDDDNASSHDAGPSSAAGFSPQRKRKRCSLRSETVPSSNHVCFFCDLPAGTEKLHEATTLELDTKVKECAKCLHDDRLMAKLATSDMIAVEAKYHLNCLRSLLNRKRAYDRRQASASDLTAVDSSYSLALAQLIAYIEEIRSVSQISPVFKLADLVRMFGDRLRQLGCQSENRINSTRLKEKILLHFDDMCAQEHGRDVILVFSEALGDAITKACATDCDEDALHLSRAAAFIRNDIFSSKWHFSGVFSDSCQEESVPPALLALVSMLLEGPSIDVQNQTHNVPAAVTIAQLIVFNSVKHRRRDNKQQQAAAIDTRHSTKQETPLPLYVSLALYASTRKRSLIDKLFNLGICVSYDRVLSVTTALANGIIHQFEVDKALCPPNLRGNVFTTAAVDNIDHNPSSTSAKSSFHGTGISLFQNFEQAGEGCDRYVYSGGFDTNSRQLLQLPASYACVPPARLLSDTPAVPSVSSSTVKTLSNECLLLATSVEYEWLNLIADQWHSHGDVCDSSKLTWSAFHSSRLMNANYMHGSAIATLPLFRESANSVAMICHAMAVVNSAVQVLNPGQVPVLACDQPLFALAKQIQWNWPNSYGEDKFVVLFGGLHVEMAALKTLGSFLTGSGWTEMLTAAGITTAGTAESLLHASHVRRTRRMHEITVVTLHALQRMAYDSREDADDSVTFDCWCEEQSRKKPMFCYWTLVKQFELDVLLFVRAIRESNFSLYVSSLQTVIPWFFAFDRTHYCRWLSVHIRDMISLPHTVPDVFEAFTHGKFTVHKTLRRFSALSVDQAHEQQNAVVKGDGGAVGLTENEHALHRWLMTGPELARLVADFESRVSPSVTTEHHEEQMSVQQSFMKDVSDVITYMLNVGNPFDDCASDLVSLISRDIVPSEIAQDVGTFHTRGKEQYEEFVKLRLGDRTVPLSAPLKRNKFSVFSNKSQLPPKTKQQQLLTCARNDASLFSRLYIACQVRSGNLEEFFKHENQSFPPSLSDMGKLRSGTKSDLLKCLEQLSDPKEKSEIPNVDCIILDGAAIVHLLKPGTAKTFDEYSTLVFVPYIMSMFKCAQRIDVVWDCYKPDSLKASTRSKRGSGVRRQVLPSAPIPKNWSDFLHCDLNKQDLFVFLATSLACIAVPGNKVIVTTADEKVLTTCKDDDFSDLMPCTHEEADTRMLLHADNAVRRGSRTLILRTVDTDVVVLAIAVYSRLGSEALWVEMGTGKHVRYIAVHELVEVLSPENAICLPLFHAFTGCDTVSAFSGRGKKTCWDTWTTFPEVTSAFTELSAAPSLEFTEGCMSLLERYVVLLYDRTSESCSVNDARRKLFSQKLKNTDSLPPTRDALVQHARRAVYQAGYVWYQTLSVQPVLPSPSCWGWQSVDSVWQPLWMTIPEAAEACTQLIRCGCKTGCSNRRCKCVRAELECTALCACDGECRE